MIRIEALLSARLFLRPKLVDKKIYFLSNLSGKNSLYVMDYGGSVPQPLLPPDITLQNPHLIGGKSFEVFKNLERILVMIDQDGDENYLPMQIPITGGFPESAFKGFFNHSRCHLGFTDVDNNLCIIIAESRLEGIVRTYLCRLDDQSVEEIYSSPYGGYPAVINDDWTRMILVEGYQLGDTVAYLWEKGKDLRVLYGKPIEERVEGEEVDLVAFGNGFFTEDKDRKSVV